MGEAKRRKTEIEAKKKNVKLTPRQQVTAYGLMHADRLEKVNEDGTVYAVNVFMVVDAASGIAMAEETPQGKQPIVIQSVPQPVGKRMIATPTSPILARG